MPTKKKVNVVESMSDTIAFRVTPTLKARIEQVAQDKGLNVHEMIRSILSGVADKHK